MRNNVIRNYTALKDETAVITPYFKKHVFSQPSKTFQRLHLDVHVSPDKLLETFHAFLRILRIPYPVIN